MATKKSTSPLKTVRAIQADPRYSDLCMCIEQCWQSIGYDAEQAVHECGEDEMTRSGRLELCIDANRMQMYPGGKMGKASDAFVTEVCAAGHYKELMRALTDSNVLY